MGFTTPPLPSSKLPGIPRNAFTDGLVEQYRASEDVLEYLGEVIVGELKGAAYDAERERVRALRERREADAIANAAASASFDAKLPEDAEHDLEELANAAIPGFWTTPETKGVVEERQRSPSPERRRNRSPSRSPSRSPRGGSPNRSLSSPSRRDRDARGAR